MDWKTKTSLGKIFKVPNIPQMVGFEPTLHEGNWFRVSRLNHSATSALSLQVGHINDRKIVANNTWQLSYLIQ